MENAGPVVLVVGVVGLIGGLIWLAYWLEKKRTEFMQGYAESKGLTFLGANQELWKQLETFKLFGQGHSRKLRNAMRGLKEVGEVHVADYKYVTGSGKHQQTHEQTIVVVRTPGGIRQRALISVDGGEEQPVEIWAPGGGLFQEQAVAKLPRGTGTSTVRLRVAEEAASSAPLVLAHIFALAGAEE